jgi:anti-sigma B factor antagonist
MGAAGNEIGPAPLELDRSTDGFGRVCLTVAGEIDISNLDRLRDAVSAILAEPDIAWLALDFTPLEFIDSSGVAVLVQAKQAAERRGIEFCVLNAHGKVQRVLAIIGVDKVLSPNDEHRSAPGAGTP